MTERPTNGAGLDAASYTDEGGEETEKDQQVAWGARIARTMSTVGFSPKNSLYPSHVEYAKMYADAEGRTARVTALIAKGLSGVEVSRLESFVLTVQVHIPATIEAVEQAPEYLRPDLRTIVSSLGGADEERKRDVVALDCTKCGKHTSEFMVDRQTGKPYCPSCFKARKSSPPTEI